MIIIDNTIIIHNIYMIYTENVMNCICIQWPDCCIAVRETCVPRHHGGQLRTPMKASDHQSTIVLGVQGGPN